MIFYVFVAVLYLNSVDSERSCYWNAKCPYDLYSSKTPYDAVRGDIRDYSSPGNCEAVSVWSINRHGNRNPGGDTIDEMKGVAALKEEIIESYEVGRSQLCAQDIENLKRWAWNDTIDVSHSYLTGVGYEELFDIGKRLRERYPHLLDASEDKFYFRTTNEQRTITSSIAFVHGLTENTDLNLPVDGPWPQDNVIRPYENCDKYQQDVVRSQELDDQINAYTNTKEYRSVQSRVQERLGIRTELSLVDIYSFYEICRFYRSWSPTLQSPWCAVFSDEDLVVMEYRDDIRHYYRNGYGSWVNTRLGGPAARDLYENFEAVINGTGRNIVSYFTHDTMVEMFFCALGMFKDNYILDGATIDPNRLWKTSFIASFSANFIAVLNRCQESGSQTYRVQLFVNEKESELCPTEGCTWEQFQEKLASFKDANLDFCSLTYVEPSLDNVEPVTSENLSNSVCVHQLGFLALLTQILLIAPWR